MRELTSENVHGSFFACLWTDAEIKRLGREKITETSKIAPGILTAVGFNGERLKEHEQDIIEMLQQLPDEFEFDGGWAFVHACMRQDGAQWTGSHATVEQLMLLGIGIGKVEICSPRDTWHLFPGGLPYFVVNTGRTRPKASLRLVPSLSDENSN